MPLHAIDDDRQFTVFPIKYPTLWRKYKQALASFWTADEVDLSVDIRQWGSDLSDGERHVLTVILAFFAVADGIVAANLTERFATDVDAIEAKFFYAFQASVENIHAETYSVILEALVKSEVDRTGLHNATLASPVVTAKTRWALKWLSEEADFSTRLVAFAAVEGIFFSSSFAVIHWFKSKGKMPGVCFSNDMISRDEALHTEFACELLNVLRISPSEDVVHSILAEAVDIEIQFARESLSIGVTGLTVDDMGTYVRYITDQLSRRMGYRPLFGVSNPLPFMNMMAMESRTNFFERQNADYRMPGCGVSSYGELDGDAFA